MSSSAAQPDALFPDEKPGKQGQALEEQELHAALQLLVERAQFITGATGAALALPQGEEMVCRASAGSSAPPVGARLQVRSGLTGESITRRQLLRCDNAENDPRVNLETCRELGIASIVVMPLLRRSGEVRGLFELFSDHAYAFEERDLTALERMADLTLTALDLAESQPRNGSVQARTLERPIAAEPVAEAKPYAVPPVVAAGDGEVGPELVEAVVIPPEEPVPSAAGDGESLFRSDVLEEVPAAVPEAMLRVQKCSSCGFPVSAGRTLCLDCEKSQDLAAPPEEPVPDEFVPAFLDSSPPPPRTSWLADHVNLLAIVVLILGVLVAIVVFR